MRQAAYWLIGASAIVTGALVYEALVGAGAARALACAAGTSLAMTLVFLDIAAVLAPRRED